MVSSTTANLKPYSAGILEDPDTTPPADMWQLTVDPMKAPNQPEDFTIEFSKGIPSKLEYEENGKKKTVTKAIDLFLAVNAIAKKHGVGRIDIVCGPPTGNVELGDLLTLGTAQLENRFIGIKSRGCVRFSWLLSLVQ